MFERSIHYDDDLMWWHVLHNANCMCTHDHYRRHDDGCGRWEDRRLLWHVWSLVWKKWTLSSIPRITFKHTHTSSMSYQTWLGCCLHSNVRIAWHPTIQCRQAFTVQYTSQGVNNRRCTQPFKKSWQLIPHLATHIHSLKYAIDVQTRKSIGIRPVAALVGYQVLANLNSSGDR